MSDVVYARVEEAELDDDERARLSVVFPARWLERSGVRGRAWTQRVPLARVVASSNTPVGQAAVCELRQSDPRVLGIGDLVVAPAHRRLGVGSTIIRESVALAADRGADVIVVASRNVSVRRVFGSLGFRPCKAHELVFRQGDLISWNETWLVRGPDSLDLVEILGDV